MKLKNLLEQSDIYHNTNHSGDVKIFGKGPTLPTNLPRTIVGDLVASGIGLESLVGCPRSVRFVCDFSDNKIKSIDGINLTVGGDIDFNDNYLTHLKNIHKFIKIELGGRGKLYFLNNPIKSHILGLMLIDNLKHVEINNLDLQNIINEGLRLGKHWTEVQAELEEAGFEEYAQL